MNMMKQKAYPNPNIGPKQGYKKPGVEGYSFQNGEFVFSSDIRIWMCGKIRRAKNYPNLF